MNDILDTTKEKQLPGESYNSRDQELIQIPTQPKGRIGIRPSGGL